ncbi:MAG TPA: hypothetical protein VJ813_11320 [Vicinamibacterales bacterium]|nr:hypothetical protein [Vicinamibacterales bacterium]
MRRRRTPTRRHRAPGFLKLGRAILGLAALAGIATAIVIRDRHRETRAAAGSKGDTWDLVDDFTQAAAGALPDESVTFDSHSGGSPAG